MIRNVELGMPRVWTRVLIRSVTVAVPVALAAAGVDQGVATARGGPARPGRPGVIAQAHPAATMPRLSFALPWLRLAQPGFLPVPLPPRHLAPAIVLDEPPAPATDYGRQRSVPTPRYAAPLDLLRLHPPYLVPQVAPIMPSPNMIRIGGFVRPAPAVFGRPVVDGINRAAAEAEARVDTFGRSLGIRPSRADRIAAATIGGAAVGIVGAGLAAGVLAGGAGAGVGALLGAGVGAGVALVPTAGLGVPLLPLSVGAGALVGAVLGGAVPAALVAVPAALAGGVAGGLIGAYVGSTSR